MDLENIERKLTTILCADVAGYSRLMGKDEEATLRTLSAYREIIDAHVMRHRGRVFGDAGDSVLAEFRQHGRGGAVCRPDSRSPRKA